MKSANATEKQLKEKASNMAEQMVNSWSSTSLEGKCLNTLPNMSLNCSPLEKYQNKKYTLSSQEYINCEWQNHKKYTPGPQEYKLRTTKQK